MQREKAASARLKYGPEGGAALHKNKVAELNPCGFGENGGRWVLSVKKYFQSENVIFTGRM